MRRFVWFVLCLAGFGLGAALAQDAEDAPKPADPKSPEPAQIPEPVQLPVPELAALEKRFALVVRVQHADYQRTTLHGELQYRAAEPRKVAEYARVLHGELSFYPQQFVERSGLRMIVLCTDLHFKGQKRSALPDRSRSALLYDIAAERHMSTYVRHVIHHEFFHVVDWAGASWRWRVPEWKKLNAPDFEYGQGGHTMQADEQSWSLATGSAGFLNRYSTSSVAEDMAELYAFLMTQPKAVERAAVDDEILAAKVATLKRHLRWFSPYLDDEFWVAAALPRPRPRPSPPDGVAAPPPPAATDAPPKNKSD